MSDAAFLKGARISATGTVLAGPSRLFGIHWFSSAGGGLITIRDGGAGGTTMIAFSVPVGGGYINIPQRGVKFNTDVHVTLPATTEITVLYDPPQ